MKFSNLRDTIGPNRTEFYRRVFHYTTLFSSIVPVLRNFRKKIDKSLHSKANIPEAVKLVERCLRAADELKNIKCTTLHRYVKKNKAADAGVEMRMTQNH